MSLQKIQQALRQAADPVRAEGSRKYFKDSAGDVFVGVDTPTCRRIAKENAGLPLEDACALMRSPVHEERSVAHMILVLRFSKGDEKTKKLVYEGLLRNRKWLSTWDAVDGTAPYIVGPYLFDRDRSILYRLARSRNLYERRIAMVSTLYFIRKGRLEDTFRIAEILLEDGEDLIHKATGWMLREAGKKDQRALEEFLKSHYDRFPRTALRYAIERFPETKRQRFLKGNFSR